MKKEEPLSSTCSRCGGSDRTENKCPYRKNRCHYCKRFGHLASMCPKKNKTVPHLEGDMAEREVDSEEELKLFGVALPSGEKEGYVVNLSVGGRDICMQLDT